mgnify:CR=1 FL=1
MKTEKEKRQDRDWYIKNRKRILEKRKKYYKDKRKIILKKQKKYNKDNYEKISKRRKKYRQNNSEQRRQYVNMKRRTDLKLNLDNKISSKIRRSLKGKKNYKKWETLVGYTKVDLIKRLKYTLPQGYTWQDFLDGKLHIDHIIPISAFNYNTSDNPDFKRCWALTNLRLLTEKENRIKGNKLEKPFQPALKILGKI